MPESRNSILTRLREKVAAGRPIIGGGAGTGLSAKCEEAGGIDLIVIYNSGRYRMAGRGSLSLRPDEIDWVGAAGNYLELHAGTGTHLIRETIRRCLPGYRCSRRHACATSCFGACRRTVHAKWPSSRS